MGKSVPLVVRLPEAVYDEVKKAVDEKKLASSYSGFCRQVVIERLTYINSPEAFDSLSQTTNEIVESSEND